MKKENLIEILNIEGNAVAVERIDEKNFKVNLTQLAKPYGKLIADWLRLKSTKEYLLYRQEKCYGNSHITFDRYGNFHNEERSSFLMNEDDPTYGGLIVIKQGGNPYEQGTWCTDYHIALDCMAWLDTKRKDAVYDVFYAFMHGQLVPAENTPIAGVAPILYMNSVFYPYNELLKAFGMSTISGAVWKRKRLYPREFIKIGNTNFVSRQLAKILDDQYKLHLAIEDAKQKQCCLEFKED